MITIVVRRFGPLVVAATVNDNREVTMAVGLTESAASRRLIREVAGL